MSILRLFLLFDLLFVHLYGNIYIYRDKEKMKGKKKGNIEINNTRLYNYTLLFTQVTNYGG